MPEKESATDEIIAGRTFWSGTITFGLVSVPVRLLPANRSDRVSLRMVSPAGKPLSRRYFATRDERPLDWSEVVRGYEIEKDRFVVVDEDELERLAPERTRDIDLRVFVPKSDIDPMHFERAYYLTPAEGSTKAYRLLARVMEETGRAGIATFVMRAKEYLVAILAENGILRAETLRFADEVRTPEMVGLPEPLEPKATDVKRIEKKIAVLTKKRLEPDELEDRSSERMLKLVEKKRTKGEDTVRPEKAPQESRAVIDLVEALQRSLQGGGSGSGGRGGASKGDGASAARGDGDLSESSKAELYERAKELDVAGRSGMTKDELIEAIRQTA